jgi:hypothetical protein
MTIMNKRPKITGSDTHAGNLTGSAGTDTHSAGLSGTATQAENTSDSVFTNKAGFTSSNATGKLIASTAGTNEASVTVTTPSNSSVIITATCYYDNDGGTSETLNLRILDGTTTLESTSGSIGANTASGLTLVHVDTSPETGSRTYNAQAWANGGILFFVSLTVTHVQLTDTHAGSLSGSAGVDTHEAGLTGSNTQTVKNTSIIM